ncbi:helix-turn-helix domain-containing protein [Stappia taiwanensis]|uniref:Helix-turn-helix domain-containing protein n=1 Tax=Stappia taiwanensis TaxID=992267 RepID=A0A838XS20_9HYPH|nr:helix-turn-helix domain-containing protein [Stappia taiwanensis]MBA4611861.1 helix-turn-helix domain-containing protein [Stappia taiwanensis]
MNRTFPSAPEYGLYGEPEQPDFPDVLHVERLAVRSGPRHWQIAAHRHPSLHQIFWIGQGGGTARLDGTEHRLDDHSLINVPAGTVHGFRFRAETEGTVVTLPSSFADPIRTEIDAARLLGHPAVCAAGPLPPYMLLPLSEAHGQRRANRSAELTALATLLLIWSLERLSAGCSKTAATETAAAQLFARFQVLLERHFDRLHPVSAYAERLAVSAPHLSRVCRAESGRPASSLIRARQMLEARRLLAYTQMSVSEVAYRLGFADPAYFSRVFAAEVGHPPRQFRKRFTDSGV